MIKKKLHIIIIVFFIILVLIVGIFVLHRIDNNKDVLNQNIYCCIPDNADGFYQINKSNDLSGYSCFFNDLKPLIQSANNSFSYPFLIIKSAVSNSFLAKVTAEQENSLKGVLSNDLYKQFKPKSRIYNEVEILYYPDTDDRFFSCFFHEGIFAAGYNSKNLELIIDKLRNSNSANYICESAILDKLNVNYPFGMYLKDDNAEIVLNGGVNSVGDFSFLGYIYSKNKKEGFDLKHLELGGLNDSIVVEGYLLLDKAISYTISSTKDFLKDDFVDYFEPYSFLIKLNDSISEISCLKYKNDKFLVFNKLNDLEKSIAGKRFNLRDVILSNQHVYEVSTSLSKLVFNEDVPLTLAFYKDYLIYSKDRASLQESLKQMNMGQKSTENPKYIEVADLNLLYHSHNFVNADNIPFKKIWSNFPDEFKLLDILGFVSIDSCQTISVTLKK